VTLILEVIDITRNLRGLTITKARTSTDTSKVTKEEAIAQVVAIVLVMIGEAQIIETRNHITTKDDIEREHPKKTRDRRVTNQ
jgi:hypothetical protein